MRSTMSNATMTDKSISQSNPNAWRNPWVIGWILLVVIVLVVNIAMISLAFITNPGLVTEDYYEKGQDHEQNINKKIAARNALGWTFSTDFPTSPVMKHNELYRLNAVDKYGKPLTGAEVSITAYRPSDSEADFKVLMIETLPGLYEAKINYPLKGIWELTIILTRGEDTDDFVRRTSVVTN